MATLRWLIGKLSSLIVLLFFLQLMRFFNIAEYLGLPEWLFF